jgi:Na+/proline symporter
MNVLEHASSTDHGVKMVALAGFLGGVLSMSFVDGMNKRQRCAALASGMVMAHYLSPLIANLFSKGEYQETIGFLVGLFGMSITSAIFRAIKSSDLWALFEQRFGAPRNHNQEENL